MRGASNSREVALAEEIATLKLELSRKDKIIGENVKAISMYRDENLKKDKAIAKKNQANADQKKLITGIEVSSTIGKADKAATGPGSAQ